MTRAITISQLLQTKFKTLPFKGDFERLIGKPELRGSWLVWGQSGNGKTSFVLQLVKYLTQFGRVAYDSMEEGNSLSMQRAFRKMGMEECGTRLVLLNQEPISELTIRLRRRRSPEIIVIDSLQYTGLSYTQYKELRDEFPNKLFIIISHAEGKEPEGRVAKRVKYDAFVKIRVEGYVASAVSRYSDNESEDYVIWRKGAEKYWGTKSALI